MHEPHPLYLWTGVCGDTVSGAGCFGGKLLLLLLLRLLYTFFSEKKVLCAFTLKSEDPTIFLRVTRMARTVLLQKLRGPDPASPVSNIQLETGANSSAEFPKAGF